MYLLCSKEHCKEILGSIVAIIEVIRGCVLAVQLIIQMIFIDSKFWIVTVSDLVSLIKTISLFIR